MRTDERDTVETRIPPGDNDAEESVLGCLLLMPSLIGDLGHTLDPSDFWRPQHGLLYQAMIDMYATGQPVDTVTISSELRSRGHLDAIGGPSALLGLQNATPAITNAHRYAELVIDASRRRRAIAFFADRIEECYRGRPIDEIIADADPRVDDLIASRSSTVEGLSSIADFVTLATRSVETRPWLIPHVVKAMWKTLIVATEGAGKGNLLWFLALHSAAGRDPWQPSRRITPVRCLYVDAENADEDIVHQVEVVNTRDDLVLEAGDNMSILHREGGMNLRTRRAQAELEATLQRTRAQIVFAGPLYKLFRRGSREDMEQVAIEVTDYLDDLRKRFNIAILIEHHAPKGTQGKREMVPFGSGQWMRWPQFGLTLEAIGNVAADDDHYRLEVGRFRRDRGRADWPQTIERGASMSITAWTPWWRDGRTQKLIDQGVAL